MLSFLLGRQFAKLLAQALAPIIATQRSIMATLAEVQADQATVNTDINALIAQGQTTVQALADVRAELAALKAQGGASPSDLDGVDGLLKQEISAMSAVLPPLAATGDSGATGPAGPAA